MERMFMRNAKPAPSPAVVPPRSTRVRQPVPAGPSAQVQRRGTDEISAANVLAAARGAGPSRPPDTTYFQPRFGQGAGGARVNTDMRTAGPVEAAEYDQRFGRGIEDPLHQPMLDEFRRQQGQPPGGIDEQGFQVGPSDAEIKYRPQPIAVLNGPFHAPIDEPATVGMEIAITVQMSGGDAAELASVQDSEQVGDSFDHTGSFAGMAPRGTTQSGFMSARNIPNDRHGSSRAFMIDRADNFGGGGSYAKHQLDIYTHARRGVVSPIVIPNSGYRVTRTIIADAGGRLRFRVDKVPEACTVNGFTTTAGPSPAQHDEVVLRP